MAVHSRGSLSGYFCLFVCASETLDALDQTYLQPEDSYTTTVIEYSTSNRKVVFGAVHKPPG